MPVRLNPTLPPIAGVTLGVPARERLASAFPGLSLQPQLAPPCRDGLLRLETGCGLPLNHPDTVRSYWHRAPYCLTLRLVRYEPNSERPETLDAATIGTRGRREEFQARIEEIAARLVADAIAGRSRGALDDAPARPPHGRLDGRIDRLLSRWRDRLMTEWWSVGLTETSLQEIVATGQLGNVGWLVPRKGEAYLADPFPWPGTDRILCEEMPMVGGHGRIVAVTPDGQTTQVVLQDDAHHSYPCTFTTGGVTYLLPEATERGATTLYRLAPDGRIAPVCAVAPGRRLADATLFQHEGRYWIGYADLDIGAYDTLCLLHATDLAGPWQPHRLTPALIDIRAARPAGPLFRIGDTLYRPGQDCTATYGCGITISRIERLTPDDYRESAVMHLVPDRQGPFPDGLHTLATDGVRTWVDGKRFVLDWNTLTARLTRRLKRVRTPGQPAGYAGQWT